MHRRTVVTALSLALAGCGGGHGNDNDHEGDDAPPSTPDAPAPLAVDMYGDSILAGYGVLEPPARRMAQARPQWKMLDHSAYGIKLSDLMPNLPYVPRSGAIVVLELGLNDALAQDDQFEAHLRQAIELLLREGRTPVLTGLAGQPNPTPHVAQFNAITVQLASRYGLEHAHWYEDYRPGDVVADGIHRTQEASDRLTALLVQAIERAALARKQSRG